MPDLLLLRKEVSEYMSACERLISAATMPGNEKLSDDECQAINYYVAELSKVAEYKTATDQR